MIDYYKFNDPLTGNTLPLDIKIDGSIAKCRSVYPQHSGLVTVDYDLPLKSVAEGVSSGTYQPISKQESQMLWLTYESTDRNN